MIILLGTHCSTLYTIPMKNLKTLWIVSHWIRRNAFDLIQVCLIGLLFGFTARAEPLYLLENAQIKFQLNPATGQYEIQEKTTGEIWRSNPFVPRLGEAVVNSGDGAKTVGLSIASTEANDKEIKLRFSPRTANPQWEISMTIRLLPDGKSVEFALSPPGSGVESIKILEDALWVSDTDKGFLIVPCREGLLIPASSGQAFTHRFNTFSYEGCHMEMLGIVKNNTAAMVSWHDPYVGLDVKSSLNDKVQPGAKQILSPSITFSKLARNRNLRLQFLGRGDYNMFAAAYRQIAKEKGWLVTWDQKLPQHPDAAKLFGAINFKLWSCLSRQMSEDSSKEISSHVSWTFDEAAQIASHLKNDLRIDKALYMIGGWIHRGYDNQHPDILPAAPECGGNDALAACSKLVQDLGYLFCLHDNYQDIYRDSPSWDTQWIMKKKDGSLTKGGHWAGGVAYLTCSQKALELARRPQNLPEVRNITGAKSYFIDTTYAAGLQECFDPTHPLTYFDDMKWKQELSDYSRNVFGLFGSECGREWAIPHSDFFEGITGVSGNYFHDQNLVKKLGAYVIPFFEMVYHDTIAAYGKYGYDIHNSAAYVLHHLILGRTMHYHDVPSHLYWKNAVTESEPLQIAPQLPTVKAKGSDKFEITYGWLVLKSTSDNWHAFVHFTDPQGKILFQNDYAPTPPTSQWKPGLIRQGPFVVTVPRNVQGPFEIRVGFFNREQGTRAPLALVEQSRQCKLGSLQTTNNTITFIPSTLPLIKPANAGLFVRADQGWAEGRHPYDRFVKNTTELLSPLNEITSKMRLETHRFLTPDFSVQESTFGSGAEQVIVIANFGAADYIVDSRKWGAIRLPQYGLFVESPRFLAFHARSFNGIEYANAPMFTLRSLDNQPLDQSGKVRIFHGWGNSLVKFSKEITVSQEMIIE